MVVKSTSTYPAKSLYFCTLSLSFSRSFSLPSLSLSSFGYDFFIQSFLSFIKIVETASSLVVRTFFCLGCFPPPPEFFCS